MSSERFKSGDTVQYKGEGPVMHVLAASVRQCYCNWVDVYGQLQQATFDERNLTHAAQPDCHAKQAR